MLLRFAVSNHLSIKETQELSLIKSALKGPECGLISPPNLPKYQVLPAAIIYGPNASGKSNFLDALMFMRNAVLNSHSKWDADGGVPRKHFRLNKQCADAPSRFEIDFIVDDVRYNYGFACNAQEFLEEWLYSMPTGRQRLLFSRTGPGADDIEFGPSFTGPKQNTAQMMRSNSLFISAAFQNNSDIAKTVVRFFRDIVGQNILNQNSIRLGRYFDNEEVNKKIVSFLMKIGTGINQYRRTETEKSDDKMRSITNLLNAILSNSPNNPSEGERKSMLEIIKRDTNIEFAHTSEDGEDIFFETDMESLGTRRLVPLLHGVFTALEKASIFIIDEIDASLHTQICEAIIALFTNKKTNPNGAQIIATTHDTNILNADNLRRDEIWLIEKSPTGASEVYSLADIKSPSKSRSNDNYERGYLQGRYGAIPFAGSTNDLLETL